MPLATVANVTSTRRRAALGAIGASVLLLAATACASGSDDAADSLPAAASAESTVVGTGTPSTEAPTAAAEPTTAPAPTEVPAAADAPTPTEAPVTVPEALQFTAPLVGGGTFDGAAAAGKPTVFWFWAPT